MSKTTIMMIVLLFGVVVSNIASWVVVGGRVSRSELKAMEDRYGRERDRVSKELMGVWHEWDSMEAMWRLDMVRLRSELEVVRGEVKATEDYFRGRKNKESR